MRVDESDTYFDEFARVCYEDDLFTGELEFKGENGELLELSDYYSGLKHGTEEHWYPDGQKKLKGVNYMNSPIDDWYQWHPNGRLAVHRTYARDSRQLHIKRWDVDGNLIEDKQLSKPAG
jgi:antitoxin component YwqK of YwqJK toxin-antitoxin module